MEVGHLLENQVRPLRVVRRDGDIGCVLEQNVDLLARPVLILGDPLAIYGANPQATTVTE
jgi:hypothetical protein